MSDGIVFALVLLCLMAFLGGALSSQSEAWRVHRLDPRGFTRGRCFDRFTLELPRGADARPDRPTHTRQALYRFPHEDLCGFRAQLGYVAGWWKGTMRLEDGCAHVEIRTFHGLDLFLAFGALFIVLCAPLVIGAESWLPAMIALPGIFCLLLSLAFLVPKALRPGARARAHEILQHVAMSPADADDDAVAEAPGHD